MADKTKCPLCGKSKEPRHSVCTECYRAGKKAPESVRVVVEEEKRRERPKEPSSPKCPQCNQRPLPPSRLFCFECRPDYKLTAHLSRGEKKWQLLVQSYKNGKQTSVPFKWRVTRGNIHTSKTDETGCKILDFDFSLETRAVTIHVIGVEVDTDEVKIPPDRPDHRGVTAVDPNQGMMGHFLTGWRGGEKKDEEGEVE